MSDRAVIKGHSIFRTIDIAAPRAEVWSAITEPERINEWLGERAEFSSFEVGATGEFEWEGYGTFPIEITEIVPLEVFAFRWPGEPREVLEADDSTVVKFELSDTAEGTQVALVESGFDNVKGKLVHRRMRLEQNREGWNLELDELAGYLEN